MGTITASSGAWEVSRRLEVLQAHARFSGCTSKPEVAALRPLTKAEQSLGAQRTPRSGTRIDHRPAKAPRAA